METKDIQKLIDFISQSGLDEVNIETSELKLAIKRYSNVAPAAIQALVEEFFEGCLDCSQVLRE